MIWKESRPCAAPNSPLHFPQGQIQNGSLCYPEEKKNNSKKKSKKITVEADQYCDNIFVCSRFKYESSGQLRDLSSSSSSSDLQTVHQLLEVIFFALLIRNTALSKTCLTRFLIHCPQSSVHASVMCHTTMHGLPEARLSGKLDILTHFIS